MAPDGLYGTFGDWDGIWLLLGAVGGLGVGSPACKNGLVGGGNAPWPTMHPIPYFTRTVHMAPDGLYGILGVLDGVWYCWGLWEAWVWGALHAKMAR